MHLSPVSPERGYVQTPLTPRQHSSWPLSPPMGLRLNVRGETVGLLPLGVMVCLAPCKGYLNFGFARGGGDRP